MALKYYEMGARLLDFIKRVLLSATKIHLIARTLHLQSMRFALQLRTYSVIFSDMQMASGIPNVIHNV